MAAQEKDFSSKMSVAYDLAQERTKVITGTFLKGLNPFGVTELASAFLMLCFLGALLTGGFLLYRGSLGFLVGLFNPQPLSLNSGLSERVGHGFGSSLHTVGYSAVKGIDANVRYQELADKQPRRTKRLVGISSSLSPYAPYNRPIQQTYNPGSPYQY